MAVPKTTQTRYMDGSVQRTTQVTPSLHLFFIFVFCTKMFPVISQQSLDTRSIQKKRCRDGVTCVLLCTLPSIYLVCVVFGTAIPTSLYIFGKCFSYLFACIFFLYYSTIQEVVLLQVKHQHLPPRTEKYCWLAKLSMFLGIILGSEAQWCNFDSWGRRIVW